MTAFTVTITDTHSLAGITAARNAYNATIPVAIPPAVQQPPLATDADYVQFVMDMAAQSYAKQFGV